MEREEQEILARREQVMLDLAAAQTEATNQETAAQAEEDTMEGERDLDDDVPEAEADESDISTSEDEASMAEEGDTSALGLQADVTFNEDSFIEGSMMQAEVEHMLEREEAEMSGVLQDERDLDDDIPEAGSYEHTDTELDSSDEEGVSYVSARSVRSRRSARRSSGARTARSARTSAILEVGHRGSFGLDGSSSVLDGSSFLRSSPAAARGTLRSRFLGARASGGG